MIPIPHYLTVSAILFTTGAIGVLMRRNALIMLMSIELMLNAVNLSFVAYARLHQDMAGQVLRVLRSSASGYGWTRVRLPEHHGRGGRARRGTGHFADHFPRPRHGRRG